MRYSTLFQFSFLLITISSVLQWCSLPIGNTALWWFLRGIFIILFAIATKWFAKEYPVTPVNIFLAYVAGSAIIGAIMQTENYWDWKMLVDNTMIFSLPLAVYAVNDELLIAKSIKFWFKWAWILFLVLCPFFESDAFGRFLVPYTFTILMLPLLDRRLTIASVIAFIITIIAGYESRADVTKFSAVLILGIALWIPVLHKWFERILKPLMWGLLAAPIVFLWLGATGTFNVLNIEEELGIEGKYMMDSSLENHDKISMFGDTRTFLYVEEIKSAIDNNYVIWGRTPARGYNSLWFGDIIDEDLGVKRGERGSCEVSILNVFNYFGIVGVLLYFAVFAIAAFKAIYRSENRYIQVIGLYVAFRWLFGFLEDFSRFDLNMMFLWFMIGMCYSERFRKMNDEEFELWFMYITHPDEEAEEEEELYNEAIPLEIEEDEDDADY